MIEIGVGTKNDPFKCAPDDWDKNGLPYGAWCICDMCGTVARSTITFDYYKVEIVPNAKLKCESCMLYGRPTEELTNTAKLMNEQVKDERAENN